MILITGPLMSGKRTFAATLLGCAPALAPQRAACEVQQQLTGGESAQQLAALAQQLAQYEVVTITETGGGVVPADPAQRARREAAGRLGCLLAQRADTVVRVFCGLPLVLKGAL